jgi:hypothetical protein
VTLDTNAQFNSLRSEFLNQLAHPAMWPAVIVWIDRRMREHMPDVLFSDFSPIGLAREPAHFERPLS